MYTCISAQETIALKHWRYGFVFSKQNTIEQFFLDSGVQRNAEFGWTREAHRLHTVQRIVLVCCIVQTKRALSCGGRLVGTLRWAHLDGLVARMRFKFAGSVLIRWTLYCGCLISDRKQGFQPCAEMWCFMPCSSNRTTAFGSAMIRCNRRYIVTSRSNRGIRECFNGTPEQILSVLGTNWLYVIWIT